VTTPDLTVRSLRSLIYLLVRVAGSLIPGKRATIVGMGQLFIVLAVALVAAALVFGVTVLIMGGDQGLDPSEPDSRAVPLPGSRPLTESDIGGIRFDITLRGYRMAQVDQALRRAGYDLGYKEELISVLEAEVDALRAGRVEEADSLRTARESAARPAHAPDDGASPFPFEGEPTDGRAVPAEADGAAAPDGEAATGEAAPGGAATGEATGEATDGEVTGDGEAAHRSGIDDAAAHRDAPVGGRTVDGPTGDGPTVDGEAVDVEAAGGRAVDGGTVDGKAGEGEPVEDGADLAERGWPVGFGQIGDPAAAEPAK
jgi:DivIVA domain-containing protein